MGRSSAYVAVAMYLPKKSGGRNFTWGAIPLLAPTPPDYHSLSSSVARGGYGEVWQGTYRGDPVAIKVFSRDSEASCKIEYEIYTSKMLNHESIVRFIAVDRKFEGMDLTMD